MKETRKASIRFDLHTWMLLEELSTRSGLSKSLIIRALVRRALNNLNQGQPLH